jgi:hypothetical protein
LIDHAWTYRVNEAREHLAKYDGLLERMCNLMHIQPVVHDESSDNENKKNQLIELVMENMWKYNQTYNLTFENMVSQTQAAKHSLSRNKPDITAVQKENLKAYGRKRRLN